jgi:hypothetical protein
LKLTGLLALREERKGKRMTEMNGETALHEGQARFFSFCFFLSKKYSYQFFWLFLSRDNEVMNREQ